MAAKPHPDAWLLAYQFGYAHVQLISLAETNWIHADNSASMAPESVERQSLALSASVGRFAQLLRNQRQKRRCQGIAQQMAVAWDAYRGGWRSETHEAALIGLADLEPEEEYQVARAVLLKSPLNAAPWIDLKRSMASLMVELPSELGKLAQLGQAVAQASFNSILDSPDEQRGQSPAAHVTVIIHDRIQANLRSLSRGLSGLKQLDCDLSTLTYQSALQKLDRFHTAVLKALKALAESPVEATAPALGPRLRPTERAALDSYQFALSNMDVSDRGRGPTHSEFHAWLGENYEYPGRGDLPSLNNWSRYLRNALRKSGRSTTQSRRSMPTTRSIVRQDEVFTQRHESTDD